MMRRTMQDKPEDMGRSADDNFAHALDCAALQRPASRTAMAGLKLLKALGSDLIEFAVQLRHSLIINYQRSAGRPAFFRPGVRPHGKRSADSRRWLYSSDLDARTFPTWLLLTYKLPPEPATRRLELWRRLKGMGGTYLQNGVCLLPRTDERARRLKVLEHQINTMGGDAIVLEAFALDRARKERVVSRFNADRDEAYREFIVKCDAFEAEIANGTATQHLTYAELEEHDADLSRLRDWLDRLDKLDFYGAGLAAQASRRFRRCEILLDHYARSVFEAHDAIDLIRADRSPSHQRVIDPPTG
jgi:hypothetical protein